MIAPDPPTAFCTISQKRALERAEYESNTGTPAGLPSSLQRKNDQPSSGVSLATRSGRRSISKGNALSNSTTGTTLVRPCQACSIPAWMSRSSKWAAIVFFLSAICCCWLTGTMYWMRRNLSSEFVIYFRKSFSAPWGTATETVPTWTYISKYIFLFCLTAPKGHGTIPPPPPWGGRGGPAATVPSPGRQMNYIFLLDTLFRTFPLSLQCKVLL